MNALAPIGKPWPADPRFTVMPSGTVIGISGRPVKPRFNGSGYARISVNQSPGKNKDFYIHRIVLETFAGPCPPGCEADHINHLRSDNRATNLRWLSRDENLDRRRPACGEKNGNYRVPYEIVRQIRDAVGSQSQIGKRFGVSREFVRDVKSGKARKYA